MVTQRGGICGRVSMINVYNLPLNDLSALIMPPMLEKNKNHDNDIWAQAKEN